MSTKPVIVFVDDEPHNLAVFEAALPETWDVKVFDNPLAAVDQIEKLKPSVIVSDQRMPGMKGVKFLELAGKLCPNSVRILVTGYTDEDLIIESVRAAKIFDYIRKPWDPDELVKRLEAAIEFHRITCDREELEQKLKESERELKERNIELTHKTLELQRSMMQLEETSRELTSWVPPVVTYFAKNKVAFPVKRDLAVLVIDIIGSGAIHGRTVGQKSLKALALEEFAMLVLKHGGFIESTEGDAAYANFGLLEKTTRPCDAAIAVANEFRAALKGIASHHQQTIECGIALHFAPEAEANISEYTVSTPQGVVVQKRFYTSSSHIDLVHRMEKLVHILPGSNIVFSESFLTRLSSAPDKMVYDLGSHLFKGQKEAVALRLIKSSLASDTDVLAISTSPTKVSAA